MNLFGYAAIFFLLILVNHGVYAQSKSRAAALKELESLRAQIKTVESILLEPSTENRAKFSDFLRQPDTGLIRLLPREKYDFSGNLTIRGGGAFYSFARLTHEYGYGSDISFERGYLSVGFAGGDYGFLAKLGDLSLDDVTLEAPSVQTLAQHQPPTLLPEARKIQRLTQEGFTKDGVLYKARLTALVGNTYILRSINYDFSDVLVAFQIVREDTDDGSLILAWKLLKKFPTPRLDREQANQNSN